MKHKNRLSHKNIVKIIAIYKRIHSSMAQSTKINNNSCIMIQHYLLDMGKTTGFFFNFHGFDKLEKFYHWISAFETSFKKIHIYLCCTKSLFNKMKTMRNIVEKWKWWFSQAIHGRILCILYKLHTPHRMNFNLLFNFLFCFCHCVFHSPCACVRSRSLHSRN